MKKSNIRIFFLLHIMLMIYSMSGICSKMAAKEPFLSPKFILFYSLIIVLLGFYAIGWQQIIKRIDLTTAYANKAITTVWGLIWGIAFFQEKITVGKLCGVTLVVIGVIIFAKSDDSNSKEEEKDE